MDPNASEDMQKTLAMTALSPSDTVSESAPTPAATQPEAEPDGTEPAAAPEMAGAPAAATPQPAQAEPSVMLDPSLQDHAVVTEAPPTPTEIAPAAKTTEKTATAPKKEEPAQAPPKDTASGKGGFRETMWFMDAVDPEALSGIENEDIRDRAEKFDDDGREIDDDTRRKFSLSAGGDAPGKTQMAMAAQKLDDLEAESKKGGGGMVVLVLIVLGGIGAAAWFFLQK